VTADNRDTYSFNGTTFNGPTAVGNNATAWTGYQHPRHDDRRYDELRHELTEFRTQFDRCMSTLEPVVAQRFGTAIEEAVDELDRRPVHPDRLRDRLQHLVAAAASVGGMAVAADRLRQRLSGLS
jgi:hypothetical protein